jgi:hypothetical protein
MILVAARSIFSLFSPDEETFANSLMWEESALTNLLHAALGGRARRSARDGVGWDRWCVELTASFPKTFRAFASQFLGSIGTMSAQWLELFVHHFVVGHKEVLDFFKQMLVEVLQRADIFVIVAMIRDGHQPVVPARLSLFGLLGLDHTDQATGNQTAGKNRLIHEHQHIERIAIFALRTGQKSRSQKGKPCRAAALC